MRGNGDHVIVKAVGCTGRKEIRKPIVRGQARLQAKFQVSVAD